MHTTLEGWEKTEMDLQHCFSEYGISHVTIAPEILRNDQIETQSNDPPIISKCRLSLQDEFDCVVHALKRRKPAATAV
ncbi:hypothetical protein H0H87_007487 [Tephrocybe sp. NHM501043]|nr:hypothetical protein H0H87_007487 [Tephrocybe sp. NHM501043]